MKKIQYIKKLIFLTSLLTYNIGLAESANYTLGNSNPFTQYQYKTDAQWENVNKAPVKKVEKLDYFSNAISSPVSIKNKKYQYLLESSNELNGCWDKAASTYKVDPWLLMAIAKVESGFNKRAFNKNTNKSIDLGMMQINTIWLPTLKKFGIESHNLFEPCTSVFVGAWIVAQNIKHFGYNQDGIGAYNSPGNITLRRAYARKVYASYNELIKDFQPQLVKN